MQSSNLNTCHAELSSQVSQKEEEITFVTTDLLEGAERPMTVARTDQPISFDSALLRSTRPGPHPKSFRLRNFFILFYFYMLGMNRPLTDRFTLTNLARLTYKMRIISLCFCNNKHNSQGSWHSCSSAITRFLLATTLHGHLHCSPEEQSWALQQCMSDWV